MQAGYEYRHFVVKLVRADSPTHSPKARFQESWETLMLGTVSTAIGFAVLLVVLWGMNGKRLEWWHVERAAIRAGVELPVVYLMPNRFCAVAAVVGECLALAGILLGWWRRAATSLVCVLGIVICLLPMILFCAHALMYS